MIISKIKKKGGNVYLLNKNQKQSQDQRQKIQNKIKIKTKSQVKNQIRIERHVCIHSIMFRSIEYINRLLNSSILLSNHETFIKNTFLYTLPVNYQQYYTINSNLNAISLLYIICSISTKQWYIGETCNNLIQRMTGHINCVCQYMHNNTCNIHINERNQKLYTIWSRIGLRDFVIIPIEAQMHDSIDNRKRREMKLIKFYKPTLNTQHNVYMPSSITHHLLHKNKHKARPLMHRRFPRNKNQQQQHGKNQHNNITNTIPLFTSYYTSHNLEFNDLNSILKIATPGTIISVHRVPGRFDFTYTKLIKRKFRSCFITSPIQYAGVDIYSFIILHLRNINCAFTFKIWIGIDIRNKSNTNIKLKCLKNIVNHPHHLSKIKRIKNFTPSQLLSLRMTTSYIKCHKQQSIANARIYNMLMKVYHINYNTHLTIRIPFSPYVNKQHIKTVIMQHVQALQLPSEYIEKLINRLRIVLLKSKSIGEILVNNIQHAKQYDSNNPPTCICDNESNDKQHIKYRPDDFDSYSLAYKVLSQNNKNIPIPTRNITNKNIKEAILNYSSQIRRMTDYKITNTTQNNMCKMINDNILTTVKQLKKQTTLPIYNSNYITDADVNKIKNMFKTHVISSLDKNNGQCLISCPLEYYNTLTSAFVNDTHYLHIDNTNSLLIIERFRKAYVKRRIPLCQSWYKLCGWYRNGKLPYVYINYKNKDVNKYRPIMSFTQHPMRSLYKLGGRALTFLINQIPNNYKHFNLFNPMHVKTFINNTNQQFSTLDVDNIYPYFVDIKNMYTEMKHKSIMNSVYWCISVCTSSRHHDRIAITRSKISKYPTHWGRSFNNSTHTEIMIQTIIDIIEYDMNNVIFTLGNVLLTQVNGIPMGGFISAPEAQLVCIYSEVQFHLSIGTDAYYISGSRYMDDLTTFIAYKSNNVSSMQRVLRIIHELNYNTYDASLEMEAQEAQDDGSFTYLESLLKITNNTIMMKPYQKNWKSIQQHKKQKLYKLQHYHSYSPNSTKLAMIIGTLYRLDNYSLNDQVLFQSIIKLHEELKILKYPQQFILKALHKKYHSTNDNKWLTFKIKIRNMPPNILLAQL